MEEERSRLWQLVGYLRFEYTNWWTW